MKDEKKKPKIYAFIDSQNLNLSVLKDLRGRNGSLYYRGWKLDFPKFRVYLKDKYKVTRAFLFIGYIPSNQPLYTYLEEAGFTLIFKPTLEYHKGKQRVTKGNVDGELILNAMIKFRSYDKAIIVAGDGDYHCLLEYLLEQKKLYKLLIPNRYRYSSLLRKFSPYIVYMNGLRSKLEGVQKKRD